MKERGEKWGRGDTQPSERMKCREPGRNRGVIKEKRMDEGRSVVAVIPAGAEGDVLNTFMLGGDVIPTLRLRYHGLSIQEAKTIQVAH